MALLAAATWPLACAAIHRPPTTIATLREDLGSARAEERATRDSITERLARRAARRGDRTLDILLLSGGGQLGAYGAGFLRGWRSRPDSSLPVFDLVTGISTGGLQAPFALLGTPAAFDTLSVLYRDAVTRTPARIDLWYWLRRTGGILKSRPLERTIAGFLDERMAGALREEFARDRQLVIGTTDADLGLARTWDLARVFGEADGAKRARTLLRATSAIPGVFPPVILDGHVHTDGGVISNVMPVLDLADYRRLATRLQERGVEGPVTVRVWLVMNLFLDPSVAVVNPANRGRLSTRATALLYFGQQPQMVERLATLARAVSADVPGLRMELRSTAIHPALASEPGAEAFLDKAFMVRIEALGYERARSANGWDLVVGGR